MPVYVKIPSPVAIFERVLDPSTGMTAPKHARTMTLVDVVDWITNDNHFAKSAKMGKVAAELLAEFETAPVGALVKLTTEQHDHVKKVLEAPSAPFIAIINKQIVPLLDALAEPLTEEQYRKESTNGRSDAQQPAHA